jgi:hypothetical protein
VKSSDNFASRKITSAPKLAEISAISGSSVLTITEWKEWESIAARIGQEIMGCPAKSLMFFLGIRLLPPRAGMNANLLAVDEESDAMRQGYWPESGIFLLMPLWRIPENREER